MVVGSESIWVRKTSSLIQSLADILAAGEFTTIGTVLLITIAVLSKDRMLDFYRTHFPRNSEDSVGLPLRDGRFNEQGDKLELPNETVHSRKSQNANETQERQARRRGQDADQITEPELSRACADSEALADPQRPASTNVSLKKTWLKGIGFGRKSESGVSASRKRKVNESSV